MLNERPRQAPCPQCGQTAILEPSNRWRPFCTRRCKLIDFGDWLSDDDDEEDNAASGAAHGPEPN
jgi:endogenous inhibitor of DNA gyrase (YacG/DUF329 family)